MEAIVKEVIIPWKGLIGFAFVILVVALVQLAVYGLTLYEPKVKAANITCTVKSYVEKDGVVTANLQCGEHEAYISNAEVLAAYLAKPQPLICTLYEGREKADCKVTEK
jgi:hypothetical protein